MRNYLLFIIILTFSSCKNEQTKPVFSLPNSNDINEIVETIITFGNLPVTRKDSTEYSFPISSELQKLDIFFPEKEKETPPPPPVFNEISIYDLLHSNLLNKNFAERDSAYFLFQNQEMKSFILDEKITKKLIVTDFEKQIAKKKSGEPKRFYYLSIPIFSFDNNKAYVEVTCICAGCGGANSIFLEKIKNKWTIIDRSTLWMN
jgi:hypothetical protein